MTIYDYNGDYSQELTIPARNPFIGDRSQRLKGLDKFSPVKAYKFLHSADLLHWESGSVKIDTMSSYAIQDEYQLREVGGVADARELYLEIAHVYISDTTAPEEQLKLETLDRLGVFKADGPAINLNLFDLRWYRKNRYVYCLSDVLTEEIYKSWKAEEGYDCVLEIENVLSFIQALQHADAAGERRLTEHGTATVDWVDYINLPLNDDWLSKNELPREFFFFKDVKFSWQCEMRASWPVAQDFGRPREGRLESPYSLDVENLMDHVRVIDIPDDWKD